MQCFWLIICYIHEEKKKNPQSFSRRVSIFIFKGVHYVRNVKRDFFPLAVWQSGRSSVASSLPSSFLPPPAPPSVPLPPSPPLPGCRINVRMMKTEYRSPGALTENDALKKDREEMRTEVFVLVQTLDVVVKWCRVRVPRAS